ncbi:GntR family transcriptional regulator [Paenibacillus paeoniae]|uniref:GntR family transcriptional regulator n=1 Tax=Paenibacillus paeoniae TaxID=2292705 RepID=A0A371PEZ0_9BACL|nr:GntR family transcriptional regulator [Paenibacillus paeoniae]REK74186.1 GntR family transcriptional regulator [Paenibacillus paeoniae]
MMKVTPKLSGENNKEYAYRVIKENMMSLQLQPGQEISEIDLAASLQLSRTPVREVLSKLKEEHLVEVYPQVGTYVSKITAQLINEAAFMRFTLEKEILTLSCKSFPPAELQELKKNVALQELLLHQQGMELEFHKLDTEFHHIIFRGNSKEHVWTSITRLSTHYNRMRLLFEMEHRFDEAILQHKNIITLIENKETHQVENIVREHILKPIKHWPELYQADSAYARFFDLSSKIELPGTSV